MTGTLKKFRTLLGLLNANNVRRLAWYLRHGNLKALCLNAKSVLMSAAQRPADGLSLTEICAIFGPAGGPLRGPVPKYDVVVPVYNGLDDVRRLIESVLANTTPPYRLIVVDDCSPDPQVVSYLEEVARSHSHVTLLRNQENLGFARSVNLGASLTENHFAIVNSDVEVPPGWLPRLMYSIASLDKVASSTPFTNSGSITSFPEMNRDNALFEGLDCATIDRSFQKIPVPANLLELPTGVGFCMGINREVYREIGLFDAELFGRGYGEENDWCLRAGKLGYRSLLAPNLFVYHKHGASFSPEEKSAALQRNLSLLLRRHPEYQSTITRFAAEDPLKGLRGALALILSSVSARGVEVVLDHTLGGGSLHYRERYVNQRVAEGWSVFVVLFDYHADAYSAIHCHKGGQSTFPMNGIDDLFQLVRLIRIDTVTINSLVTYPAVPKLLSALGRLREEQGARVRFLLHDYFPVCPSFNLLDRDGSYCGVPAAEKCADCITRHHGDSFFHNYGVSIDEWRGAWGGLLEGVEVVTAFSNASRDIFAKAFPDLPHGKLQVLPHGVDYLAPVERPRPTDEVVIGIPGTINYAKGVRVVQRLAAEIERRKLPFRIVVLGSTSERIAAKSVAVIGRYERRDLPSLISAHGIHVILIPSVWPETFSYTTEEAMKMELPVAVFDLGAPGERVRNYRRGVVLENDDPATVLTTLDRLVREIP